MSLDSDLLKELENQGRVRVRIHIGDEPDHQTALNRAKEYFNQAQIPYQVITRMNVIQAWLDREQAVDIAGQPYVTRIVPTESFNAA